MRFLLALAASLLALPSLADVADNDPAGRMCTHRFLQSSFPTGAKFKVQPNLTILAPNGKPVVIRGVQMFDYLFSVYDFRGWNGSRPYQQIYRTSIYTPVTGKGPGTGVSEPTYNARYLYINHANVAAQLSAVKDMGINFVRVIVEPANQFASVPYVDPSNGQTYPSDMTMLDDVVNTATEMGLIVDLSMGRDEANFDPAYPVNGFMAFLGGHYKTNPLVWLNPSNEYSGTAWQTSSTTTTPNTFTGNVPAWATNIGTYINSIRGAGFTGPIILNDPDYANNINAVYSTITTTSPFNTDGNLIYGIHVYTQIISGTGASLVVQSNWVTQGLPSGQQTRWAAYLGLTPMFIEETGNSCSTGGTCNYIYDPEFGTPLNNTTWAQMQNFNTTFLNWSMAKAPPAGFLNGVTTRSWFEYTSTNPDPAALWVTSRPTTWQRQLQSLVWNNGRDGCIKKQLNKPKRAVP